VEAANERLATICVCDCFVWAMPARGAARANRDNMMFVFVENSSKKVFLPVELYVREEFCV
jgi:hypothetical protein